MRRSIVSRRAMWPKGGPYGWRTAPSPLLTARRAPDRRRGISTSSRLAWRSVLGPLVTSLAPHAGASRAEPSAGAQQLGGESLTNRGRHRAVWRLYSPALPGALQARIGKRRQPLTTHRSGWD